MAQVASGAGQPPRYSLTFKLLPAPMAQVDFSKALDAAGHAVASRRWVASLFTQCLGACLDQVSGSDKRSLNGGLEALVADIYGFGSNGVWRFWLCY